MHIEIQVAINYVMLQLYEKLPRRRVNIFGEELERALKDKFEGHWYPDAPEKGSGYRCLKVGRIIDPPDPLLEKAAYDSGLEVHDILEHLPKELNIWIDPGEVSFRIGDKGPTEILYSTDVLDHSDNEVARTFNPEAKCFRPTNELSAAAVGVGLTGAGSAFNPLVIAKPASPPASGGSLSPVSQNGMKCCSPQQQQQQQQHNQQQQQQQQPLKATNYKNGKAITPGSINCFAPRTQTPTFTTATFAQTKFGSTKLKTNSKRTNRMSPTEFANYIKHKAQMQQHNMQVQHGGQQQQQQQQQSTPTISLHMRQSFGGGGGGGSSSSGGSSDGSYYGGVNGSATASSSQNHFAPYRNASPMDSASFAALDSLNRFSTYVDSGSGDAALPPFFNHTLAPLSPLGIGGSSAASTITTASTSIGQNLSSAKGNQEKHYLESFNFALNSPGPSSPYQHLLLAN